MQIPALTRVALFFALLLIAGCGGGAGVRPVESQSFLGDTSQLAPGRADEARLLYINEQSDFSRYAAVALDRVVIWGGEGTGFSGVTHDELEGLASYFDAALRDQLAHEFELVETSAPGTLRIRVAIVEGIAPRGSGESTVGGRIGIEVEILDAATGERLIAAADTREGLGVEPGSSRDGSQALRALDEWALGVTTKLSALRRFDAAPDRPAQ